MVIHRTEVMEVLTCKGIKGKAIPVTGRGGPWSCETSRLPHLLDSRLTVGGKVESLTRRPPFTSQEDSWYSFLLERLSRPQGQSAAGRIRSFEKFSDLIGNRTRTVPQPTTLPRAPVLVWRSRNALRKCLWTSRNIMVDLNSSKVCSLEVRSVKTHTVSVRQVGVTRRMWTGMFPHSCLEGPEFDSVSLSCEDVFEHWMVL
jgi:hypothetical protein